MRHATPVFAAAACLLVCWPRPPRGPKTSPNADICASTDEAPYSPEQRIAACGALIDTLKNQPQAQAAALVNRGATYWTIDKTELALADFARAIALDPHNARAFRERSNAYRGIGQLDKALADANDAVRLDPNNAQACDYRGNVFNNNQQYDRAIADYNEAIRLKPDDAQSFMDRGVAYYFKKDYQAAIGDYDQAIKLDPKKSRAFLLTAAPPIRSSAAPTRRSPTKARQSNSIHWSRNITTITSCPMPRRAITTAPSPTITRRSGSSRRRLLSLQGRLRPCHRRLRPRAGAQSGLLSGLQQPRRHL